MDWKRAFTVTGAIGAPFIALLAFGMTRDPRTIPSPMPGKDAPLWTHEVFAPGNDPVQQLAVGDSVRLADLKGRIVVMNFWASWCLACREEHAELSAASTQLAARNVKVYGFLYNDSPDNGVRWISDMGGQAYPSLTDPGARTAIEYGLYGVPETFIVDQLTKVAYKFTGPVTEKALIAKVDSIIKAGGIAPGPDSAPKQAVPAKGTP